MPASAAGERVRPRPDRELADIADYVCGCRVESPEALDTARWCLLDALACGFEALGYPARTKLLGPIVPGTVVPHGAKVPGTANLARRFPPRQQRAILEVALDPATLDRMPVNEFVDMMVI